MCLFICLFALRAQSELIKIQIFLSLNCFKSFKVGGRTIHMENVLKTIDLLNKRY